MFQAQRAWESKALEAVASNVAISIILLEQFEDDSE